MNGQALGGFNVVNDGEVILVIIMGFIICYLIATFIDDWKGEE